MHSLKTSCVGQVFALSKPHDAVGKRTRNRIPKEERKTLVESFIKKHQRLNNGSFPSLSLTHKEVGGSFYTIREIVREIIQENRVLGTSDLVLQGKGDDHLLMDPVPPEGFHSASGPSLNLSSVVGEMMSAENVGNIMSAPEGRGSDVLNGHQLSEEGIVLLTHDGVQTICDSFASKPQDKKIEVDKQGRGSEETPFTESNGTKPVDDEAAMTQKVNMEAVVVETFPIRSMTSTMDVEPSQVAKVCEGGDGTESKVENETCVDLGDISSSMSAVPEEQGTQVIGGRIPNQISVPKVEEKTVNPASVDVESADTTGTVVENAVISSIHKTKDFSNGSLTTQRTTPTSGTESGSLKKDTARSEVTNVEKATGGNGKHDASDSSSSQKGNIATLNRIKPESWKGQSNAAGHEGNPLLAALKSFLTAFVKFWSE